MSEVVTPRQRAQSCGETTYFTGRPCKHGHICPRYVADMKCVECIGIKAKANWKKRRETHGEFDRQRGRRYREQNREKIRDYSRSVQSLPRRRAAQKKWRDANKEYERARKKAARARDLSAMRARENAKNAANREAIRARDQARRDGDRDRYNATKRAWSRNNRDRVAHKARQRRARHARADAMHTPEDIVRIGRLQNDRCAYCRIDLARGGYVDHIIALANGGSNWPKNLQLVCRPCNSRKGTRHPVEFARQLGRLL